MSQPKGRVVFRFRFLVICAALLVVIFIPVFRSQDSHARQQRQQLESLQEENYTEVMREAKLRDQLKLTETDGFREREARRRYGYGMPGVMRFVAAEGTNEAPVAGEAPAAGDEPVLDKDWSNF